MSNRAQYLLAALIITMAISAGLLQWQAAAFFGPEGGDPILTAVFASAYLVLVAGVLVVKRRS